MEAEAKSFNAPETKLHFLDYWRIIRIRKTIILAVFLLVTLTTALVTFILPKSYSSTVRMKVEKDAPDVAGIGERNWGGGFDPYWVQTEFETIQSKSILIPVITNLSLHKTWAQKMKVDDLPLDLAYTILKRQIDVRQSRNTSLIEIRVISEDKNEAATIANDIADVYKKRRLNLRLQSSLTGIAKLEEDFNKQNAVVTNMQAQADKIKTELGITDMEAQGLAASGTVMEPETLRQLEKQRIEAQTEYEKINTLYQHLASLERPALRKALLTASPDPQLNTLQQDLATAEQKLSVLVESYAAEHPEVKSVKRLISLVNTQIEDRVEGIMEGLKARTLSSKAGLVRLQEEVDKMKTIDIQAAVKRRPYFALKRDLDNANTIRERIRLRIEAEKIDAYLPKQGIVDIIDLAEPGLKPVRPNKVLNLALGIIVGLAVGIGLAFFIEYLDTSVKTIDDVERALQAPVVGVIPQNVGYLIEEGPDSPHAEAYRVLRTNIMFSQKDPTLNTVTVVSGGAGEGKSTTIFNLATVFAQNGQRVLLVDSDLRRPSLHKILKVSNSVGLTNYLLKQSTLEEVIQTTPISTLDFLPSGKMPSSSMGVLSSMQMKDLIRELKRRYDWVFFDSPPIMGVSDASILSSEVDMVLQVIQYRRYPQPMTIRAKQMIEKVGGNLLGIVLNNISMAADENYYYYSGYYYDYYSKQDEDEDAGEKKSAKSAKSGKSDKDEPKVEIKQKY